MLQIGANHFCADLLFNLYGCGLQRLIRLIQLEMFSFFFIYKSVTFRNASLTISIQLTAEQEWFICEEKIINAWYDYYSNSISYKESQLACYSILRKLLIQKHHIVHSFVLVLLNLRIRIDLQEPLKLFCFSSCNQALI